MGLMVEWKLINQKVTSTCQMGKMRENETLFVVSFSEKETTRVGELIGGFAVEGSVIAIIGLLGSGKTHLSKGVAKGLGVQNTRVVTSPTFAIMNQYVGRMPIYHFDTYRFKEC